MKTDYDVATHNFGGKKLTVTVEIYQTIKRFPEGIKSGDLARALHMSKGRVQSRLYGSGWFERLENGKWVAKPGMPVP